MIEKSDNELSTSHQSVTEWLNDLKQGDLRAAQNIFDRYLSQLIRVANRRLGHMRRRVAGRRDPGY